MNRYLILLVATIIAALSVGPQLSNGCRCVMMSQPQCRTDYLALIKITGVTVDEPNYKRFYSFETISDISYSTINGTLKGAATIETALQSATCGAQLELNTLYVLGGTFVDHRPFINTCHAFIEQWTLSGEKSVAKLSEYQRECEAFRKKNSAH